MTKKQAEVIMVYADNNMSALAAGKAFGLRDVSMQYHLPKIFLKTGRNPRKFFDLCYLVGIAAQILGGNEYENKCNCKPAEGSGLPKVRTRD